MAKLVIIGSIAFDDIKTPFGEVTQVLGGAASYASVAASFFTKPKVVSVIGEDFPQEHMDFFHSKGIDTSGIETLPGKTFHWKGYYENDMNQAHTVTTDLNVLQQFSPKLPEDYKKAEYLFLGNIAPSLQLQVLEDTQSKFVALDTMNYWIDNSKEELMEVIRKVQCVIINESEARQLFDTPSLVKAGEKILKEGPQAAIIKQGEYGALLFTKGNHFSAPAYPLEIVKDPTGAGDSFAGGLMGYLTKTDDVSEPNLRRAIIYGSTIASFNAEGFSLDRLKEITKEDIEQRYAEFGNITKF